MATPEMSPLPRGYVLSKGSVPSVAIVYKTPAERVSLSWECQPSPDAEHYLTGIEGSTNLSEWREVVRLPYQPAVSITLTNRPPLEFFRAFTTIRQP